MKPITHSPASCGALAMGLALSLGLGLAGGAEERPNFILIVASDLGYADLGCYWAQDFDTPHLDRMAAEGIRLTSYYAPASLSSASRAGLMTGRYPERTGVAGELSPRPASGEDPPGPAEGGLPPEEITLAELLREQGYATACLGNWHLGDGPDFLPARHGFAEYFGVPYPHGMAWWQGQAPDFQRDLPPLPLLEGETVAETSPDLRYLTRRYAERAVEFIRRHRGQPFFLYLAHAMPRAPLFASEEFSGSARYGLYGDVVQELDWSAGEILGALADLELDRRTLVIFTSANGPCLEQGARGGKADPLRDGKGSTYEGGRRVPCLARWPGRVPAGRELDGIVTGLDWLPTLARLAGARAPEDRAIDGLDAWAYLSGAAGASPREIFFYGRQAVRRGDWKLMLPGSYRETYPHRPGARPGDPARYDHPRLYDLASDPGETRSRHAEAGNKELLEELTRLCLEHQKDLESKEEAEDEAEAEDQG